MSYNRAKTNILFHVAELDTIKIKYILLHLAYLWMKT
jgi:hypothetical protein